MLLFSRNILQIIRQMERKILRQIRAVPCLKTNSAKSMDLVVSVQYTQYGYFENSLSLFFDENFVKPMFLLNKLQMDKSDHAQISL